MTRLYFDNNATHPLLPETKAAMIAAMDIEGNTSAQHGNGRSARKIVEDAREAVGLAMGVCAQDIIFTGCGTEAINQAVFSAWTAGCKKLLFSEADHVASFKAAEIWGCPHEFMPVTSTGEIDLDWLKTRFENWDEEDGRIFVATTAVNSETGVIQPIEATSDLVSEHGGLLSVDAVQALGKIPMTYQPDYLSVSAHKIGGPQGVGALYVNPDAPISSLLCGAGQERRKRAGTHNVVGLAGFGAAAKAIKDTSHLAELRDHMEAKLSEMESEITFFGKGSPRIPNTSFFAVPDQSAMTLMMQLDLEGISVSTGTACSSGKTGENRMLRAMGVTGKAPKGAIRVSMGKTTTMEDVNRFIQTWVKIRGKSQRSAE